MVQRKVSQQGINEAESVQTIAILSRKVVPGHCSRQTFQQIYFLFKRLCTYNLAFLWQFFPPHCVVNVYRHNISPF